MKTPAHRRKKDRFGRAILAPRIQMIAVPTCEECGKLAYSTASQAEVFRLRRQQVDQVALRIYPCPHGSGFHLTSKAA